MSRNILFILLLVSFLCCGNSIHVSAQSLGQLEKSLQSIDIDLQQKSLEYSWKLADEYLNYCTQFKIIIDINREEHLKVLIYEKKPQELAPYKEAYKLAKEELEKYLKRNKDYAKAVQQRNKATSEEQRKAASTLVNSIYSRLWNSNDKIKDLNSNRLDSKRAYYIAVARYMLNEHKSVNRVMQNDFIRYTEQETILSNNSELKRLSQEIRGLKTLQSQTLEKCQRLKYNLNEVNQIEKSIPIAE